ncbi:UDP-N-acetylmuramate dehydrogenase [bacterium]|nr:UDP-N-acetylmuramate dehydrogenase [bacterium]
MNKILNREIKDNLSVSFGNQLKFDEFLSGYTSFKIGGKADLFFTPITIDSLRRLLVFVNENKIPFVFLGGGTNMLISDSGFRGIVIYMQKLNKINLVSENKIYSEAGVELRKLVNFSFKQSLAGIEFASGIPGTVGGALVCNAGGKYGALGDIVDYADCLTPKGDDKTFTRKEINFGYRECSIPKNHVIVGISVKLQKERKEKVREKMKGIMKEKAQNQPLKSKSAGCIFKNPSEERVGSLIDSLNLKGCKIGGAIVSEKHANFIINNGTARASDVHDLISHIKEKVLLKKGINLETEINFVGC